jgi:hypothetical protein
MQVGARMDGPPDQVALAAVDRSSRRVVSVARWTNPAGVVGVRRRNRRWLAHHLAAGWLIAAVPADRVGSVAPGEPMESRWAVGRALSTLAEAGR